MVLYQGMYNVAHFEINNNLVLYEDVLVGDESDYKKLRKICFVSGGVYINRAIVDGSEIKGGAHVTIQDDSIFINIVPENASDGIIIGITLYLNDNGDMYAYTEKREGSPSGTIVSSFNGRTGAVVSADTDYNAGLIGYDNTVSQLVAENAQDAIDELDQEIDLIQGQIEDLDAEHVAYDNSTSTLVATNVQNAIDELDNDLSGKQNTLTFDTTPTASSTNPVTSDGVYHAIEGVENLIPTEASEIGYSNTVSQLTAIEVQSAIDELAAGKQDTLTFDSVPTDDSANPVTSDGIYTALAGKQDTLTFDSTPIQNSTNPVTSGGVYDAIAGAGAGAVTSVFTRVGAVTAAAHDYTAGQIDYDNTTSGLTATDVQAAIDELKANPPTPDADDVSYDNTTSGLSASNVQDAIDEVVSDLSSKATTATYTATIPVISGTSTTVSVQGILSTDNPIIDINFTGSETASQAQAIIDDWSKVWQITTAADSITVNVLSATTVQIPIQLKVVR